ncbi:MULTISPECIES: hypothetical protein [unclassified Bradyrhizobium]|uniref:hypothetical protein n=1 Tax=unclassified Bradyrhizobium TaxID=2631580 RepID=UPI0028E369CC|nr:MULTISPECIES: hypothetical protein [unclassified Bradyrhizobium]
MEQDVSDTHVGERASAVQPHGEFEIPVKSGHMDERKVVLPPGARIVAVLELFAAEYGCSVAELALFREGDAEPISELIVVDAKYPHQRRHHVHRVHAVKVTVHYQGGSRHREFARRATVEQVLVWAIEIFGIDASMAAEFELARHGQKEELPGSEHIGHLTGRHDHLELDLVRGDIANGSSS